MLRVASQVSEAQATYRCTRARLPLSSWVEQEPGRDAPCKLGGYPVPVSALEEFWELVNGELLPAYLIDCGYDPDGFRLDEKEVAESDAEWFLAGLGSGLVEQLPKGELWLPGSPFRTTIFWEGAKAVSPRRISLFVEGLITVATAARLHLVYGWPKWSLGFESSDYAFDLVGRVPLRRHEWLATEAKSASEDVRRLIRGVEACGAKGTHDDCLTAKPFVKNAHRKWSGLVRSKAPVFFVCGPEREWHVYHVIYLPSKELQLEPATEAWLRFPGPIGATGIRTAG